MNGKNTAKKFWPCKIGLAEENANAAFWKCAGQNSLGLQVVDTWCSFGAFSIVL